MLSIVKEKIGIINDIAMITVFTDIFGQNIVFNQPLKPSLDLI